MTLCDLTYPPQDCASLVHYINTLIDLLAEINPIRSGSDTGDPLDADLNALWAPCTPPIGAIVHWLNTTSSIGSQWVTFDGSTWEQVF
jgi:hypothetical protein